MKKFYARQGDLVIDRRLEAPVKLEKTTTPTVIAGSHDGAHTIPGGVEYGREGRVHYIKPAHNCSMTHASRHLPVPLEAGQVYAVWPQIERRGEGDVDVED